MTDYPIDITSQLVASLSIHADKTLLTNFVIPIAVQREIADTDTFYFKTQTIIDAISKIRPDIKLAYESASYQLTLYGVLFLSHLTGNLASSDITSVKEAEYYSGESMPQNPGGSALSAATYATNKIRYAATPTITMGAYKKLLCDDSYQVFQITWAAVVEVTHVSLLGDFRIGTTVTPSLIQDADKHNTEIIPKF